MPRSTAGSTDMTGWFSRTAIAELQGVKLVDFALGMAGIFQRSSGGLEGQQRSFFAEQLFGGHSVSRITSPSGVDSTARSAGSGA